MNPTRLLGFFLLATCVALAQAHAQGRRVRFWGAPDQAAFWKEMLGDGVDLINTDDLVGAQKFFKQRGIVGP